MKRGFSIFLLFVVLSSVAGTYVYFILRLRQVRSDMRYQLSLSPEAELQVLQLTRRELGSLWVNDHELRINGRMFDVARVESKGGSVRVLGLYDEDEDNLLSLLNSILENAAKDKKPVPPSLLCQLVFFEPPFEWRQLNRVQLASTGSTRYLDGAVTNYLFTESPPPRKG